MKLLITLVILFVGCSYSFGQYTGKSIQEFDVLPGNDPKTNAINLQKAIDWAATSGAALYVDPVEKPYPIAGGIVLKKNVSLIGVHGPVPRGTKHPKFDHPVGSVFSITDKENVFIIVESSTQIKGIQFWYPDQTTQNPQEIVAYPPTIQVSKTHKTEGVTLMNLTFYGEYLAMDFNGTRQNACE